MKNKIRVSFIGCGNMARAIIESMTDLAAKAAFKANGDVLEVIAVDRHESKLMQIRDRCKTTFDRNEAVQNSDYVFLAVKPQSAEEAVDSLDLSQKIVISIMAGYTVEKLKALTGSNKIVRVMPNLNAFVGESYNAYVASGLDIEQIRVVQSLLGSFGIFREVAETDMDAVTGIAGSGPAFVFMTVKAFYDEARARGCDHATAKQMAVHTVLGSVLTVEKSTDDFDALVEKVCSKGGTTIQGVNYLNEKDYVNTIRTAISKSIERARQMSEQ